MRQSDEFHAARQERTLASRATVSYFRRWVAALFLALAILQEGLNGLLHQFVSLLDYLRSAVW
jgi:hypothetical protein